MSIDDLRAVKREMEKVGREARQVMHPMEVAGVLISMYSVVELEIERRALSYVLLVMLERSARPGSQGVCYEDEASYTRLYDGSPSE